MKIKFTLLLLLAFIYSQAQVTNQGAPASWENDNLQGIAPIVMPGFDLAKLKDEDKINDTKKDRPYRFGYEFLVDYNLKNSGNWETLENGDRLWRIRFFSEGAKTMNFLFSDFYMPEGASLYLYSNDREDLLGAYDARQNNENRVLGTWLVEGEDIWLEYYEPKEHEGEGKLEIFKLVHGYRSSNDFLKSTNGINDSGNCHYDVNCTIGTIDGLKDINKKSVAMMLVGGSGFCTGALINNTSNDGTPYFLTANHCYDNDSQFWAFRFNWISENPVCATTASSTNSFNYYQTTSGATHKANRSQSDFILVELNQDLPVEWGLVWAGWNRGTTAPSSTFGIHHPSGDIMKVSRDNNAPFSQTLEGISVWIIESWEKGVTEGGSSGSPLFDNNGRIIGQLLGGGSACNGTSGNGQFDAYGRFDVSWAGGFSSSSRLKDWLDPNDSGVLTLDYYMPTLGVEEIEIKNKINVYPNPSNGVFTVSFDNASSLQYEVYNVLGQNVMKGELTSSDNTVNLTESPNGIYILRLTDAANNTTATHRLVKE